ncbi:glyoxylase-like metal-dependent hydrolase (beta-lactamase superfamily II) [Deinococcus metalli]|uniref:Glyoxylase-like metal-dependent hydrolase (Beta-lactamase superfamily II) n=1 Tax=Deinococcus metalli TaxID=1141878 RepID=A0A7W8KH79_9DEIO|nr:MBL fold metallo-hydrolase [Deinococcus metalli]MBB5376951.1 glyoxylase-like metal-dependent hydrolase (beta-lactamase superfamily II) [Deinococcus metalli]GHF46535.1 MBL fold hydrolase [Deinococcus metalli]
MTALSTVLPTRHVTSGGVRVYRLPVPAFPHLPANAFVVVRGDPSQPEDAALIDVGSSHHDSTAALDAGLDALRADFGETCSWDTLSRIVITHPHPDHVAGLPFVRSRTAAPVAAFHSAVPAIERPHERQGAHLAAIEEQLTWAGIPADSSYAERLRRRAGNLALPTGVPVDTPLHDGDVLDDLLTVIHTPGHEGSQVCLRVDDVLLSADHLLPHNSPPLMPQRMQPGAGLAHYLASLGRVEALEGVRLALGGHNGPMPEWRGRTSQLRARYADKLGSVLEAAREPITVHDLTHVLFPRLNPVQALLLLDQTGALAEYLTARADLRQTERDDGAALFQRA